MTDRDVSPPTEWFEADECPRDSCEEEFFVPTALDLHVLRDHAPIEPGAPTKQIDSGVNR